MKKATPGGLFTAALPSAADWNNMVDAGREFGERRRNSSTTEPRPLWLPRDCVKVKNSSGGNLAAGKVLEIGSALVTTVGRTPDEWVFDGQEPDEDYDKLYGVLLRDVPNNGIDWIQVAGVAYASVAVNHVQHQYCDVSNATATLQSKWHGTAKILWKSTGSTGTQTCLIQLGVPFWGPINGIVQSGGITAGSSGNVQVQYAGAASSPTNNVTVYLNWMDGGNNAAENDEVQFFYHRDQLKYVISNMEC